MGVTKIKGSKAKGRRSTKNKSKYAAQVAITAKNKARKAAKVRAAFVVDRVKVFKKGTGGSQFNGPAYDEPTMLKPCKGATAQVTVTLKSPAIEVYRLDINMHDRDQRDLLVKLLAA